MKQKGVAGMIFSDEQTAVAIDIIHMVKTAAKEKKPLPKPEDVAAWEKGAETGNVEAYKQLMCAKLQMLFPVIPDNSGTSNLDRLWHLINAGRFEGILVANSLNYKKAYEGYEWPPRLGSYLERWLNAAVKNELAIAVSDGWNPET